MPDLKSQLSRLGLLLRCTPGCAACCPGCCAVVCAWAHWPWPRGWRAGLGGASGAGRNRLLLVALIVPALTRPWRRRQVALLIERRDSSLRELVLSATELAEASDQGRLFSPQLTAALMAQAEHAVAAVPTAELLQVRRLRPLLVLTAVSLALGLSLTAIYRDSLARCWKVPAP